MEKRKKLEGEEKGAEKELDIFCRSKKTQKSPKTEKSERRKRRKYREVEAEGVKKNKGMIGMKRGN